MDLNILLKKTEARSAKIKNTRLPPSVATEDRPYDLGQSSDKARTDLGQSSDKARTDLGQSSDKARTDLGQSSDRFLESSDKLRTQARTALRTNLGQSSDKLRTREPFSALVGLQRKITIFLYQCCQFVRDKVTEPLTIEHIALSCETTSLSAQKTIQRLEKKAVIIRAKFRTGRGGWTQYELAHDIFQELLHLETQDKLRTNLGQSSDKPKTQPRTQLRTSSSSSSSILINEDLKLTTTSVDEKSHLPEGWKAINFSSLLEQGISFSEVHLLQLAQRTQHTPQMIQDAIEHFAYDLKHNGKRLSIKGDPVGFFMGILQRGMYAAPSNFVDPREAELDQYLAQQEAKLARMQEKLAKKEQLDFEIWLLETTEEQRREIAPHAKQDMSDMQKGILRNYWKALILKTGNP